MEFLSSDVQAQISDLFFCIYKFSHNARKITSKKNILPILILLLLVLLLIIIIIIIILTGPPNHFILFCSQNKSVSRENRLCNFAVFQSFTLFFSGYFFQYTVFRNFLFKATFLFILFSFYNHKNKQ